MASSTAEGLSDYFDYCERERRNLYEVLYDFDSVKMPFEYILEICRIVHFREYSVTHFDIGQGENNRKLQFGITYGKEQVETFYGRKIDGLCSTYMSKLKKGQELMLTFKQQ